MSTPAGRISELLDFFDEEIRVAEQELDQAEAGCTLAELAGLRRQAARLHLSLSALMARLLKAPRREDP